MYETVIGANIDHVDRLEYVSAALGVTAGGKVVTAFKVGNGYATLCVGADGRSSAEVRKCIRGAVVGLFTEKVKFEYIGSRLASAGRRLPEGAARLLAHALTGFDRDTEEEIVSEKLPTGRRLCLDGLETFRLGELHSRWNEMCSLASEHAGYLEDDSTMNELLRFFMDAGKSCGSRAEVFRAEGGYRLVEHTRDGRTGETVFNAFDDLLCRLIDIAPSETILNGFEYDACYIRLNTIFDAKSKFLR